MVGIEGVKNSTIMNLYGRESVELSEVQALQKIESSTQLLSIKMSREKHTREAPYLE